MPPVQPRISCSYRPNSIKPNCSLKSKTTTSGFRQYQHRHISYFKVKVKKIKNLSLDLKLFDAFVVFKFKNDFKLKNLDYVFFYNLEI